MKINFHRGGAETRRKAKQPQICADERRSSLFSLVVLCLFIIGTGLNAQQEKTIPLSDVLANPAQFHDKTIEVRGFLLQEFENSALYTTGKWQRTEGIWITPIANLHISRSEVNRRYVIATGIFNANDYGHLGQFRGTLLVRKLIVENDKSGTSSRK
ncbi:MAG TPA: hypothetical protein VGK22_13410 [Candidatus Angelobacter sp.]